MAYGGSERQLLNLAVGLLARGHDVKVLMLGPVPEFERECRASDVPHLVLNPDVRASQAGGVPMAAFQLLRHARRRRPHLAHSHLMPANILSTGIRAVSPRTGVVWGIRSTDLGRMEGRSRLAAPMAAIHGGLSKLAPSHVISNSYAGAEEASERGIPRRKLVVVENGFDSQRFRRDPDAGHAVRAGWGVGDDEELIGMVARLSPEKDQLNFVEAAGHLVKQRPRVRFVCVGAEPAGRRGYADEVRRRATAAGISDRIIWSGARSDVPAVMNALDLHVLASNAGEGCPNSVAEAMACAIPCVVTDVGDSARLVGPGGVVVPARDPEALADGCHRALTRAAEDRSLGLRLRRRIETRYSIDRMIDRTARVFEAALAGRSGRTPS